MTLPVAPEVFAPLPPDVEVIVLEGVCFSEGLSASGRAGRPFRIIS